MLQLNIFVVRGEKEREREREKILANANWLSWTCAPHPLLSQASCHMIYMILLIWLPLWTITHIETSHCLIPTVKTGPALAVVRLNAITATAELRPSRAGTGTELPYGDAGPKT